MFGFLRGQDLEAGKVQFGTWMQILVLKHSEAVRVEFFHLAISIP